MKVRLYPMKGAADVNTEPGKLAVHGVRRSTVRRPASGGRRLCYSFALTLLSLVSVTAAAQTTRHGSVSELFASSHQGIVVIAHRGCHEPVPTHGFGYSPENSLTALEHCVAMGVDMMELDVRKTADGHLVILHDDSVERTTDGHGKIDDMTLADLLKLRLRQNLGGYAEPLTDQHIATLDEMLSAAKGRITLNLDVKEPIYAEVVDAVVRAGLTDLVIVKTRAGIVTQPLAAIEPFTRVPFIPVLDPRGSDVVAVAERQMAGAKPVALELPHMAAADLPKVVAAAQLHGVKLVSNTLGDGFLSGKAGDNDVLRDPDAVWGWQYRNGISVFQTDKVEALMKFRSTVHH